MPLRSDSFENPVLQQYFRNLEALALDMLEPEPIEDLTRRSGFRMWGFPTETMKAYVSEEEIA